MTSTDFQKIAAGWLDLLKAALQASDAEAVAACFLPDGWLRDILTFTWDNRSLEGREKIAYYLRDKLSNANISSIKLDGRAGLSPHLGPVTPSKEGISSGFTFTTPIALGQGYFQLLKDEHGEWKALSVFMNIVDLIGHEELGGELGTYGGHTIAWMDVDADRRNAVEENPHVLILGGGQTGLNIAARFRQMNISTIIIETNNRIGDNWRKRYPTLSLHSTRSHHTLLYQPYPKNWPMYTPRDKLADWLEQYAVSQDLVVWTSSRILPTPTYDFDTRRWSVVVDRNGKHVKLSPAHIVLATGTLGEPHIPDIPNKDIFRGETLHASAYQGGRPFTGKNVVVIGAGNTAADICQDLSVQGATTTTMVQRSSTCIVAVSSTKENLDRLWPEGVSHDVSDFKFAAVPLPLVRKNAIEVADAAREKERIMHEGLRKAGLNVHMGSDGTGTFLMLFERFGGYWIDVGCAERIISGQIKVKQGVEVQRFEENSVVFTDGSTLPADVVIYATGYHSIRDSIKQLFGDEAVDRTGAVWGLDEEGELQGCYRPSGHPGLWYGAGDFYNSRFSSKQLALEIKAIELGLMKL